MSGVGSDSVSSGGSPGPDSYGKTVRKESHHEFISWFPVSIVLLWVCAAPYSVAAEDVEFSDCFKTDLVPATRFVACRVAAEAGHADAQYSLGYMYSMGEGVPQDYAEAAAWYHRAAEQGDTSAQVSLGYMYDVGQGVVQDYAEAAVWYRRAAEQGDAQAQSNLGIIYYMGQGVVQGLCGGGGMVSSGRRAGGRSGTV